MTGISILTERLLLRRFMPDDLPALTALNQDPKVMEFIGPVLDPAQSRAMIDRAENSWDELGYGRFAVEEPQTREFVGFIGLAQCKFESHFTPAVEIGWRLAHRFWNLGYATEGGKAVMNWASNTLAVQEIVSFTSATNLRSRRVMEKLEMQRDPKDDFEHPKIEPGEPLRPCVLYRRQLIR